MASIEREVERGLINAISGVSGLSYYTSERDSARTLPFVSARANLASEQLGTFTGIFNVSATISYHQRADAVTRGAFDSTFQSVMGKFYTDPNLANEMTSSTIITVYNAKVAGESPSILAKNRTWVRDVTIDIMATAKK